MLLKTFLGFRGEAQGPREPKALNPFVQNLGLQTLRGECNSRRVSGFPGDPRIKKASSRQHLQTFGPKLGIAYTPKSSEFWIQGLVCLYQEA